jgi:hypothetical protein
LESSINGYGESFGAYCGDNGNALEHAINTCLNLELKRDEPGGQRGTVEERGGMQEQAT